jgi:hypothetical protein
MTNENMHPDDGPCVWILNENGRSGTCIAHSEFSCESFAHDLQCMYSNSEITEDGNCYWDISDGNGKGKCKMNSSSTPASCFNADHYKTVGAACVLKECRERTAVDWSGSGEEIYPCGPGNCFKDVNNENKCSDTCVNGNHFFESTETHVCEEKECSERTSNSSEKNPCGSGNCFFDRNAGFKCVWGECTNAYLYWPVDGICTIKECVARTPDGSVSLFPCGVLDGCVLDGESCKEMCSNTLHYQSVNGICTLKSCDERISNGSNNFPCGDKCVLNNEIEECEFICNSEYVSENGVCVFDDKSSQEGLNSWLWLIIFLSIISVILLVIIIVVFGIYLRKKNCKICSEFEKLASSHSLSINSSFDDMRKEEGGKEEEEEGVPLKRNVEMGTFSEDNEDGGNSETSSISSSVSVESNTSNNYLNFSAFDKIGGSGSGSDSDNTNVDLSIHI